MKIIVTIPKSSEKWKVSFKGTPFRRKTPSAIFSLIERRIYARGLKEKASILVRYPDGLSNESLLSLDARYLLFTLACFLEDYLIPDYLNKKYKEYKQ